jgi:Coiled stalk of trimeric autotransporter adhesin
MFPKFHGIQLALNSWIANATVENLTSDPSPLSAGRIWYNTTAKALKFSSLDAGGAIVVQVVATGADVQAALDAIVALGARVTAVETSYVNKDGSVAFTGNVDAGGNKVVNVAVGTTTTDAVNFGQLQSAIQALGNAFKYIGVVEGGAAVGSALDLNTLAEKAVGSYYKVSTAGYFKVGAAGTPFFANVNDGLVFNAASGVDVIDNTDSTVAGTAGFITVTGSADTGYTVDVAQTFKDRVSAAEAAITAEVTRATAAEAALGADIAAEVTRATTAEGVLQTAITAETTRATTAEGALQAAITSEVTRATNAETALNTAITAEVTRATAAEAALQSAVTAEVTRATAAEGVLTGKIGDLALLDTTEKGSLVAALNEVLDLAGDGTDALKTAINAQRFTQTAPSAALTHTITHNLNSAYVQAQVWVRGDDNVFRNDIVAVEETSANVLTVTLTESRVIKIAVQSLANLA